MTSKKLVLPLFMSLLLAGSPLAFAKKSKKKQIEVFRAQIISCHDGDTCRAELLPKGPKPEVIKIRFSGIDAPEAKQRHGQDAKKFLEAQLKGFESRLECDGRSWERRTCVVFRGDKNINALMVSEGWAWDSPKYSKGAYAEAQKKAQVGQLGIWKDPSGESPFCFRHKKNKNCRQSLVFNP